ncbi:glycosyltransferase family 8 protein [Marinomonas arenicola]|uniref:Glycosyltransferase family 8 protein n=1 Tax=Marinomonas arenicola TaxID=569601 RepID=A0ABU9G5N6_9GAMM
MINIVLCSDENYASYSATVMVSALENTAEKKEFHFYLLTSNISDMTKNALLETIKSHGATISIIDVDTSEFSTPKLNLGRFGVGTLIRLYMHRYLPKQVTKVIYLDCDLVILGDLKQLWQQNLHGATIGAVNDLCAPKYYQKNYFNAGVLLIDLHHWKQNKVGEKALNFLIQTPTKTKYLDQDALNYVIAGKWESLDLSWNFQPASYRAKEKGYSYLRNRQEELNRSIKKPNIVHFIGPIKPWHPQSSHPLSELFISFSQMTPWPIQPSKRPTNRSLTRNIQAFIKSRKIKRRRKLTEY